MNTPATAILDANGIIGLAKADCFPLLQQLFTDIIVPPSVIAEITDQLSQTALQAGLGQWILERQPSTAALTQAASIRKEADRHVLALGLDCKASAIECFLITGDEALRRRARRFGVDSVDAPHLVQLFAEAKLLTAAQPYLDRMRLLGFGIPQPVYEEILRQLGE